MSTATYKPTAEDEAHLARLEAQMEAAAFCSHDFISDEGDIISRQFRTDAKVPQQVSKSNVIYKRILVAATSSIHKSTFPFESPSFAPGEAGTSINPKTGNVIVPSRAVLNEIMARSKNDPTRKEIVWNQ